MKEKHNIAANIVLGRRIKATRLLLGLSHMDLGRKINKTGNQISKYEAGDLVPIDILEKIGEALNFPIQKKIIRRIVFARKLEIEEGVDTQDTLSEYYENLFTDE